MGIGSNDENCYLENQKSNGENKMSELNIGDTIEISSYCYFIDDVRTVELKYIDPQGFFWGADKNGVMMSRRFGRKINWVYIDGVRYVSSDELIDKYITIKNLIMATAK
jgi:hypothetical protein